MNHKESMEIKELIEQSKQLVSQGKLKDAVSSLQEHASTTDNQQLVNALVHQLDRINKLQIEENNGTISNDERQLRRQQIIQATLSIIDGLGTDSFPDPNESNSSSSKPSTWYRNPILIGAVFFLLLSSVAVIYFMNKQQVDPTKTLELANSTFQEGKWDESREYYKLLLKHEPQNPFFLERYGYCLYKRDRFDQALEAFDEAIQISQPEAYQLFFFRGNTYLAQKNYEQAIEDFNTLLEMRPRHKSGLNQRGLAYIGLDEKDQACNDFAEADKLGSREGTFNIDRYCK